MPDQTDTAIASPCIKICALDASQICIGCGRSLDEIAEWLNAGERRRQAILNTSRQRLTALARPSTPETRR